MLFLKLFWWKYVGTKFIYLNKLNEFTLLIQQQHIEHHNTSSTHCLSTLDNIVLIMDIFEASSTENDNIIIPEEIKVEPELVLLDDDDDYNDDGGEYNQGVCMSICQTEYEEYDGSEIVDNDPYMSYDNIQLQNELDTSQSAVDEDVILIESDSDDNEGNSSDMKVLYECHLCFKTVATSYNLKRHMMIHSGEYYKCY